MTRKMTRTTAKFNSRTFIWSMLSLKSEKRGLMRANCIDRKTNNTNMIPVTIKYARL